MTVATARYQCGRRTLSFSLGPGEAIAAGLQRSAREQLDGALAGIGGQTGDRHGAIHEARKACKRLRGLLRLGRDRLGDQVYRRENAALRDAARRLSPLRDAGALLETCDKLDTRFADEVDRRRTTPVRRALAARHAALDEAALDERIAAFCADLEAVRARLADWPLRGDGFEVVAGGFRRTYQRAREAMAAAYDAPSSERFHDWRKRVKYHRYHLELLDGLWPRQIGARRKEVKALGEMLGDDHDLVVLEATLAAGAGNFGAVSSALVSGLATRRRAELRAAMRPFGQRLFAEPPKALERRFAAYWEAARTEGHEDRQVA
jgi:CHAD domain-containing protein